MEGEKKERRERRDRQGGEKKRWTNEEKRAVRERREQEKARREEERRERRSLLGPPQRPRTKEEAMALKKFDRGPPVPISGVNEKKLKSMLVKTEKTLRGAKLAAAQTELLKTEEAGFLEAEGMERTYHFKQKEIVKHVDISSAQKHFDLKLEDFGPYRTSYTRNGKFMLIGGRKGHVAAFDWKVGKLYCELHLKETVRDITWLHNESMFAVAQRKCVYIYDSQGVEMHRLKNHMEANRLEFLPYHFLLTSIGAGGYLRYHDTSVGKIVAEIPTKLGLCDTMAQNPQNAIIHLGHTNGTVTLWSPNVHQPLVKMLCHKGPVKSIAIDRSGKYMVTSGLDGNMKIWDVRTYKPLEQYYTPTPATSLAISDQDILAVGYGPNVQLWKGILGPPGHRVNSPYMKHLLPGSAVEDLAFCPFEDTLGIGHARGYSSILVPGSGEPNFDALEANPYQNKKQRQEAEVKALLEKIQPEMISLDPDFIGTVAKPNVQTDKEKDALQFEANNPDKKAKIKVKNKMRGKNSIAKRLAKKQANVIDQRKLAMREAQEKRREEREQNEKRKRGEEEPSALDRFSKRQKV